MWLKSCAICRYKPKTIALFVAVFKLIFTLVVMILSICGAVLYRDNLVDYVEGDTILIRDAFIIIASLCVVLLGLHLMLLYAVIKLWRSPIGWWTRFMPAVDIVVVGFICSCYHLAQMGIAIICVISSAFNFLLAYFVRNYGNNLPERSPPLLETKDVCEEEKDEDDSSSVKSSSV